MEKVGGGGAGSQVLQPKSSTLGYKYKFIVDLLPVQLPSPKNTDWGIGGKV